MAHVVTGAFSYTGRYVARRLLEAGVEVRTLTGHPRRPDPFNGRVAVFPYDFERPKKLEAALEGAEVLYNTYWIRFDHGGTGFATAVRNTCTLILAAVRAGVRRIVHVSIANPSESSPLPYYSGKARLEKEIIRSGLSYAILRPTVIFGREDILINNIAWFLRRFPVFLVPDSGHYRIQPVYVEDMADLMVEAGRSDENLVMDAVGPEVFSFAELVQKIAEVIGRQVEIVPAPSWLVHGGLKLVSGCVNDVVLTRDEIRGLTSELLASNGPPTGKTRLSNWMVRNRRNLGMKYSSELGRHFFQARTARPVALR
jgi:NADH dehydrogenase